MFLTILDVEHSDDFLTVRTSDNLVRSGFQCRPVFELLPENWLIPFREATFGC